MLLEALPVARRRRRVLWSPATAPTPSSLRAQYGDDDRISWLGRISDAEKFARLRGASVFCAPSLHGESFGVVLIEAMAAGTPVVASGLDGYRNVATDGVDALLVAARRRRRAGQARSASVLARRRPRRRAARRRRAVGPTTSR